MSLPSNAADSPAPPVPGEYAFHGYLVLPRVGRAGRTPVHTDALEALIVQGRWSSPTAGSSVALPDGSNSVWTQAEAGQDGWLSDNALAGGYAYAGVESNEPGVMILEAQGHNLVYVNGEPRMGDPYSNGYVRIPVQLKKGTNDFLFNVSRRRLKARLFPPPSTVFLDAGDPTLPDLVLGEKTQTWGAVVVTNATASTAKGLSVRASGEGFSATSTPIPPLPPLSIRKIGFRIAGPSSKTAEARKLELTLTGGRVGQGKTAPLTVELRVRKPEETRKITFISDIDGSVQYYAWYPARPAANDTTLPALFLSLHGAGVEAIGQADAYSPKSWGHLVAPTNRRPYGFDWEDWGRLDALEVLDLNLKRLKINPQRVYLTGHSMGGHGTWNFGANFPDKFAAIGPSAGWISFTSYGGGVRLDNASPIEEMLNRANGPGDTMALSHNYSGLGVYILHGDADDNVPIREARTMAAHLAEFHHDYTFHEQPGAGHWWDVSDEPGADCVDWAPLFDFFGRHARPLEDSVRQVDFTTGNPGVSASSHWVTIAAQTHPLQLSNINVRFDPGQRRFVGTTQNVARLELKIPSVQPGKPLSVELDGQKLTDIPWPKNSNSLWLERQGDKWSLASEPPVGNKGPNRYGPFKDAFRHRMIFVYGTKGTPEENAWAYAKARFDAETFYYRGNGSIDLVPDTEFDSSKEKDRSVILFGNADTNAAWKPLLGDSPVQVRNGHVSIGGREEAGDGLACLFLRPRPGSDISSVGAVSGTGLTGMRLTDRLSYFVSGAAYPDLLLLGPETLSEGTGGIHAAGVFGLDWSVNTGEFAWKTEPGK